MIRPARACVLCLIAALAAPAVLAACAARTPAPVEFRAGDPGPSSGPAGAASPVRAGAPAGRGAPLRVIRGDEVVVAPGGTLYEIAEVHRVSLRALIDANALEPPFRLSAGQTLALPPPNTYVVQPGDTLFAVARRHRIQPRSLALLNDLREPYVIQPGDELELPGSARDWRADAAPAVPAVATASSRFIWPMEGTVIDGFGPKAAGRRNDGLNIAAREGDVVRAAADGEVVYAGDELAGYGNLVLVKHADGWVSAYAHNRALLVAEDQIVRRGDPVAEAGSTGAVERPQLHFELRRDGRPVDPVSALPRRTG